MICNDIPVDVIATGSGGNATLLYGCILVDCGVPYRYIERYVDDIRLVCISHKHSDHLNQSTVRRLAHNRPTVRFAVGDFLVGILMDIGVKPQNIDVLKPRTAKNYGGVQVEPIELVHDVPNYGFRIYCGDKRIMYATDTKNLHGVNAPGYDLYMIEANYDEKTIAATIAGKDASGEFAYERRSLETHLSQQQADDFILRMAGENSLWMYMHGTGGEEVCKDYADYCN